MRIRGALIAFVVLAAASCGGLRKGDFKEPVVTFRNVRVEGIGLDGGTLEIVLSVFNPNGYRLDASRMTYKLFVDTLALGSGAMDKHFSVPSRDSAEVELPLHLSWNGVNVAGRRLLHDGAVPYRVTGDLTVGSGVGDFTIRYDRAGHFNSLTGASR
ncbi:MAG: LEA type 2 family protein [Gemmatimonadales bacterium]